MSRAHDPPRRSVLRRLVPAGGGLSDDVWRRRHLAIVVLAWLHALAVPAYGYLQGRTLEHAALEGLPIAGFALAATIPGVPRRWRAAAASAALLTSSAILVHFSNGLIEMHFHFFVMVPIVALYQDWIPFGLAIGYVLVHHGIVGQLSPESVYNHPWGQAEPWTWAAVHSAFIGGISVVCLATWRMTETIVTKQSRAEADLRDEKRAVETLQQIGTGIVSELDVERVAQLVTDEAVKVTGAAFGAFFYNVHDAAGDSYMLYTLSGVPRSAFESFPMPRNTKIFEPTFSGKGVVRYDDVMEQPHFGQNAPYNGMPPGHLPVRSYLSVPVRSRGSSEVLGGLFFGHPEVGVFTEREERIVVGIATQAAVAFDNARLYEGEREAREAAESARARLSMLADVGRVLVLSLDPETTLANLAKITVPTFADICVIDMVQPDGSLLRVDAVAGPGLDEFATELRRFPPDPNNDTHPVVRAIGGEGPLLIDQVTPGLMDSATRDSEHRDLVQRMQGTSSVVVPLVGRGEVLGAVSFLTLASSERKFGPEDLPIAEVLGRRAGMAVENARLYQAEREAREAADRATERLALLAESGRVIASSLDEEVTLRNLARITVPTLADACLIDLVGDDGMVHRLAEGAPGLEQFAEALGTYAPRLDDIQHPVVRVIQQGQSVLVEEITAGFLDQVTRETGHREITDQMQPTSAVIVPLAGRGKTYGSLTMINVASSGRRFARDVVPLVEEIGRRAGVAIENAGLYAQQRSVAESLQHALLPQELPRIPGFASTAKYLPAAPGERVGGDWYDLFETPSGLIAVVMGDVVGHGIPAASMMAQLRNALRAYVWDGLPPAEVLSRLNQLLYGLEREGMATVSVGLLDPIKSQLRFANAGHPPVLHVSPDEESVFVGEGLGPPLGAVPFARYRELVIELNTNDMLVFYTDGLVEDRTTTLDVGMERMRAAIASAPEKLENLSDHVVRTCLGDRSVEDDIALLVLRALPMGARLALRLPTEPRVLASFRQTLRRWLHENGIEEDDAQDILIACGEACNNAIEHGSARRNGSFDIVATIGDEIEVVVSSAGGWRPPRDDGGGRGLPVMEALMDEVEVTRTDETTQVRLRRQLTDSKVGA